MSSQSLVSVGLILALFGCAVAGAATNGGEQCGNYFQKLAICLTYATGKAAAPTEECCTSVKEIKDEDPACLCYIIQQTHNGGEQIKSMGIQEARLLQLPSACKLTNASISECPKLLNISASSPDYKVFSNSSASSSTTPSSATPGSTTTGTSLPTKAAGESSGYKRGPQLPGLVSTAVAVFFSAFPVNTISAFYT